VANAARRPWIVALQMRASRVLIAAGAIGLGLVAGVRVDSALGAQRARAELEAEFAAGAPGLIPGLVGHASGPMEASRTARTGTPVGRLTIPAVGLRSWSSMGPTSSA
jgi:hypothetical protein